MNKMSLLRTNPFLRDRRKYKKALAINVASSTAIETGSISEAFRILKAKNHRLKRAA